MTAPWIICHVVVLSLLPFLVVGTVNRTKAIWAGRKGPPLFQSLHDVIRLARKRSVVSTVTTPVFQLGPIVLLATTLVSGLCIPLVGARAPISFPFDFVAVAYLWALGRTFLILPALDTGSSFEGMGASREATYSAIVEPVLFLTLGTMVLATGHRSFDGMLHVGMTSTAGLSVTIAVVVALFLIIQVESARVPVDDPNTHLELTMIHEVMVLDHSGAELAAVQVASAVKMMLGASLIASLLNPFSHDGSGIRIAGTNVGFILLIAVVLGFVESLVARLKLRAVPQYVVVSVIAAFVALLTAAWGRGAAV